MTKLGPEAIEYRISEAEAVLAFAEALTLVPAEAAVEVPDEARKLYEDLDPATAVRLSKRCLPIKA
jgi:hypothetical protein